ncbi:MAG: Superoxide dismutase [Candidatus Collierbacteria bacterium GW2011_GWA2_46_26]|uniref:Superoxide dismutase n=1 Tax=Candidatus Collierbacteria bacterium GW2011_GWA2_46_26 TaxID=1618381 RepID=A0A0G1SIL8_9BACT|nr:MAG: Superoxide dismutase [Candidatus Collierbacteria bacterium GW2011_GWC2_44_13]KKU33150.1 MAG: Superoxide dismutase [Candidatus Collierbacteria bacterium GW2011_GWA2_46_26]
MAWIGDTRSRHLLYLIMIKTYPYLLDPLPYAYDALEPVIDKETMTIHHDKHHQAYVDNLNKALAENEPLQVKTLTELFFSELPVVKNNAGGVWNHDFFWEELTTPGIGHIGESLMKELEKSFETVDEFMKIFEATALGRFGSGWGWLVQNKDGVLEVLSTANQDNPMVDGFKPLLAIDVWEHAYYLKYKNKRADYVKAFWEVINWDKVEQRLG